MSRYKFVGRFETADELSEWLAKFRSDPDLAAALPLVLAEEIDGIGLALACDFLKELGCLEYPKPDIWVKRLAKGLGISDAATDYTLLCDLMRLTPMLSGIGITTYAFDKYLWLLGSGRFYLVVRDDRKELQIGHQAEAFLRVWRGGVP